MRDSRDWNPVVFFECLSAFSLGLYFLQREPYEYVFDISCKLRFHENGDPLTSIWQHLKLWHDCPEVKKEYYQKCDIANVLHLLGTVNKTVHAARLGLEFVCLCFLGCMIYLCVCVRIILHLSHSFPFMFWRWRNKFRVKQTLTFLLPPHYCGLWAGSIPLRAIVNKKQCETRGLFMSSTTE